MAIPGVRGISVYRGPSGHAVEIEFWAVRVIQLNLQFFNRKPRPPRKRGSHLAGPATCKGRVGPNVDSTAAAQKLQLFRPQRSGRFRQLVGSCRSADRASRDGRPGCAGARRGGAPLPGYPTDYWGDRKINQRYPRNPTQSGTPYGNRTQSARRELARRAACSGPAVTITCRSMRISRVLARFL